MAYIVVAEKILVSILAVPQATRQLVEDAKRNGDIDGHVANQAIRHKLRPGLARLDDASLTAKVLEVKDSVEASVDPALVLIALAESPQDIAKILKDAKLLGRRHANILKLDTQTLAVKLRETFRAIDEELGLSKAGVDDKKMLRLKVNAAKTIINEAIAHSKTQL